MKIPLNKIKILILITSLVFVGCTPRSKFTDNAHQQNQNVIGFFSDSVTNFQVDVYYENSAAPYTVNIGQTTNSAWDIAFESFVALFKTHTRRVITVPRVLAQMTAFPDRNVTSWNGIQLIELAESLIHTPNTGHQIANVFFVKGNYLGDTSILGIHLSSYRAAFIFKDNLARLNVDAVLKPHIEQATVVHELGHAIGLVNNGVPMQVNHEDSAHPHHSTDPYDVMYWDPVIAAALLSEQLNIFGKNSLADAHGYHTP